MRSHDVIDRLKNAEPALRATGVAALYLFGSHARDEARADPDVDVFVDPQTDETFGFLAFMKAYATIVDAVGPNVEVGYSTREGLSRYIRKVSNEKPRGYFDGGEQEPSSSVTPHSRRDRRMVSALQNVTLADYQESYALRRAAERAVQIVSEAAKSLPPEMLARHSEAPWNAIIGIGNILRHEYQRIDDRRLWEIVTVHLPELRPVIMAMIDELKD